jgi:Fic family protein
MPRGRYVRRIWRHDPALHAPARYRKACAYEAFIPDALAGTTVELTGEVAGTVSEAEKAIADLNSTSRPELTPLARLLLRTESIASSKVEGIQVESRNLARAEAHEATGRRVGHEAADVLANIDAMQFAIEEATAVSAFKSRDLIDIHRVLLKGGAHSDIAGQVRTVQNWVGGNDYNPCGADYVPPPAEDVDGLLEDLASFANDDMLPPLVQAAFAHAQFETIHPFADGNGRTGRALIHVLLRRRGLARSFVPPISVVLARRKDLYIRGLTDFREDRSAEWIVSFASAAAQAASLALRYVDRVIDLQESWRQRLRKAVDPRSDAAAWSLIDLLPAHPVMTVAVGVAATGRTKPAVSAGIEQLTQAGVLEPLGTSIRNRAWEAVGLLDLIDRLEQGEG